jgi:predicted PurR-regulated permease PerM
MELNRGFLVVLVAILTALSVMLVLPFFQYILAAILLAYVLYPLQRRLETRVPPTIAAFSLLSLAVVAFVAPFAALYFTVADDANQLIQNLERNGLPIEDIESRIAEVTGREVDISRELVSSGQEIGTFLFEQSADVFSTVTYHLIGIALALFLVYYLLKDADDLFRWLHRTAPLPVAIQRDLYGELDDVMKGVLFGHVFVAIVQGIVAGLGLYVTGIPNATFWTAVMVVFAMIPLVGVIPIWAGAAVYLTSTGEPALAVGLVIYSIIVVGITDDYLRPFAVDRYAKLNPAVILVGILGGAYAFGIMGLFFGPVVLGAFKATLRVLVENWSQLNTLDAG